MGDFEPRHLRTRTFTAKTERGVDTLLHEFLQGKSKDEACQRVKYVLHVCSGVAVERKWYRIHTLTVVYAVHEPRG